MDLKRVLTKSDFRLFLNAPRHLWARKHGKLDEQEIGVFLQHLFDQGYEVEQLAERYVKEYLAPSQHARAQDVLFQPMYTTGSFRARCDVLIRNPQTNKWDMYEIKASTKVRPIHRIDATFQVLVFAEKYKIGNVFILHLDSAYQRGEQLDISKLFKASDITADVKKLKSEVKKARLEALKAVEAIDYHDTAECIKPSECPCPLLCHPDLPPYSIYEIARIGSSPQTVRKLVQLSGKNIFDVPKDFELTPAQRLHVNSVQNDKIYIKKDAISRDLKGLVFPLHFLDYESYNPAVPPYPGYKPFDNMPFQYSLHVLESENGRLSHFEFIETKQVDPIPQLLATLRKQIGNEGSIIVWNKQFEGSVNKRMGEMDPEYKDFCGDLNRRLYDLMDIFQNLWYLDPAFHGSYSLKAVLPAMVPELSYNTMQIHDGASAMAEWKKLIYDKLKDKSQKQKIKANLLEYCKLDTLATVRIYLKLSEIVR